MQVYYVIIILNRAILYTVILSSTIFVSRDTNKKGTSLENDQSCVLSLGAEDLPGGQTGLGDVPTLRLLSAGDCPVNPGTRPNHGLVSPKAWIRTIILNCS